MTQKDNQTVASKLPYRHLHWRHNFHSVCLSVCLPIHLPLFLCCPLWPKSNSPNMYLSNWGAKGSARWSRYWVWNPAVSLWLCIHNLYVAMAWGYQQPSNYFILLFPNMKWYLDQINKHRMTEKYLAISHSFHNRHSDPSHHPFSPDYFSCL